MLLSVKLMLLYCLLFFKHHVTSFSQLPEIPSTIPRQERENSGRCQDSERTLNSITKCLENFDRCLEGMDVRSEFENCISTPLSLECPRNRSKFTAANGYVYALTRNSETWSDALIDCKDINGSLATVGIRNCSIAESIACNMNFSPSVWVGLTDLDTEGEWIWIDNNETALFGTTIRGPGRPNSKHNGTDCAVLRTDGRLNDLGCVYISSERRGLCEILSL